MIATSRARRVRRILTTLILAATPLSFAASLPGPDGQAVRDVVTIDVSAESVPTAPGTVGQGSDEPVAPTAEQRRQRARRLSRSPLARERVSNGDGSVTFVLRNLLHAPLTVEFEPPVTRGASVQILSPLHATIGALKRLEVARIRAINLPEPGEVDFSYSAVVGDPSAVHDDRVVYAWPFPDGTVARLTQGPGGPTHRDAYSLHAIDLAVAEGTPVLAARAGIVVFLEDRYFESGLDPIKYLSRSNQVRILHDDGSMASYAHLFPDSIDLEPGQRVEVGEQIGLSGNTGYSSGPHLHFVVLVHREMELVSVPFRMQRLAIPQVAR